MDRYTPQIREINKWLIVKKRGQIFIGINHGPAYNAFTDHSDATNIFLFLGGSTTVSSDGSSLVYQFFFFCNFNGKCINNIP